MKNTIGLVPDIPKIYTAVAEWLACMIYIFLYRKDHGLPYFYMGLEESNCFVGGAFCFTDYSGKGTSGIVASGNDFGSRNYVLLS